MNWKGLINAYCSFLPVTDQTPIITLHEGNTILLPATGLSERLKIQLFFKFLISYPLFSQLMTYSPFPYHFLYFPPLLYGNHLIPPFSAILLPL